MKISLLLTAAAIGSLLACPGCRMISKAEYQKLQTPESPYLSQVPQIFADKLTPEIKEKARDLDELVTTFETTADAFGDVCKTYGYRQSEDIQCNFPVKISGTVTEINTESRRGYAVLHSPGGHDYHVQIGPVIQGTALRDVMQSVSYLDFNDQTVYGDFGRKINDYCVENAGKTPLKTGAQVEIYGAFSSWEWSEAPDPSEFNIAPVAITAAQ